MSKTVTPEQFIAEMFHKEKMTSEVVEKAMQKTVLAVQSTAVKGMTETEVDLTKTYYNNSKKGHHPSKPNNYPAVDTGTLRRSITFDVKTEKNKVTGTVGSNVDYAVYLENGTSKMQPRKWLKPSLDKNKTKLTEEIVKGLKSI